MHLDQHKKRSTEKQKTLTLMRATSFFTGLFTEAKDFVQLYFGKMLWQIFLIHFACLTLSFEVYE